MAKDYPYISRVCKRLANNAALCRCRRVAKFQAEVRFNYMRGDDDYLWACEAHKKDLDFLLGLNSQEKDDG